VVDRGGRNGRQSGFAIACIVNPKLTLSYEQNHDLTVYTTVARGFRRGGINQQIPNPLCFISCECDTIET